MTCVSCGHELDDRAQYCSQCGLPVVGPGAVGSGDDESEPTVLAKVGSLGHDAAAERATVKSGGSRPILVGVSAILVGLLFWSVFRTPTRSLDGVAQGLADVVEPAEQDPLIEVEEATTEEPADEPSPTTEPDSQPAIPVVSPNEIRRLAGHYVFLGNQSRVVRLDLDSGSSIEFESSGQLVGHYDGELIMFARRQGVVTVPVDDPEDGARQVVEFDGGRETFSVRSTSDGQVEILFWDFALGPGAPEYGRVEVDLETGQARESQEEQVYWFDQFGVRWVPGGGLFEATDGGYRYIHDGFPEVIGPRYLLVRTCDDPTSCHRQWIDRRSRVPIARPLPPEDVWNARSVDDDSRILHLEGEDGSRYYDVVNERYLPAAIRPGPSHPGPDTPIHPESISPDGRYLVVADSTDDVIFYDLVDQQAVRVELDLPGSATSVLVVPKAG